MPVRSPISSSEVEAQQAVDLVLVEDALGGAAQRIAAVVPRDRRIVADGGVFSFRGLVFCFGHGSAD
jgi:type II secretory pathway component PulM